MKRIFLFFSIGLILLAIPLTVYLVGKNQEVRKKAAPASTLSLIPSTLTKKVGETFTLEAKIDTGSNQVGVVQVRIIYDPAKLQAVDITNGPLAPTISVSGQIDATGKASITVGARSTTQPITGAGTVAILTMKALAASASPVSVRFVPQPETYANALNEQDNVLIGTTPATITILNADGTTATAGNENGASPSATLTPSITLTPSPTPTPAIINFGGSQGFTYSPAQTTVRVGQTVTWKGDFASHPLESSDSLWTMVNTGTEFSHTFSAPGTYEYFCKAHGTETSGMKGQITVVSTTSTPTPTPKIGGAEATPSAVTIDSIKKNQEVTTDKPTFSGKAPPGTTVTLTIYSEPHTVVVNVDANGNWTYTPDEGLEPGPHTVTATVSNATTGQTSTTTVPFVLGSATESAIPISGTFETTLILIALGAFFMLSGIVMPFVIK
jgi:plastocyanin